MDQKWLLLWIVLSSFCVTGYSLQILDYVGSCSLIEQQRRLAIRWNLEQLVQRVQKNLLQNQMSYLDDHAFWIVIGEGLLSGLQPNIIHIGTSTASPSLYTRLVERHRTQGCSYLDARVSISCSRAYYICSR